MKYYYRLEIEGKRINGYRCFIKDAYTIKEYKAWVRYFTKKGYSVKVEKYKYLYHEYHKANKKHCDDSDAFMVANCEIIERKND